MIARRLGDTRLPVTPIGLGLAALGRPAYITSRRDHDLGSDRSPEAMARRTHALLDAAHARGVRYFDAARSYGDAEAFLAAWLERRAPGEVTIGSKWGYTYTGAWRADAEVQEVKDHSLGALRRQYAQSRALLGDALDLYQIHSATLESGVLDDAGVLRELSAIAADGIVVGLTVSGPRQAEVVRRALDVDVDGANPFRCVQATWNLLETSAGTALQEARDAGWGVIVKEAVANGRLAGEDAPSALRRAASGLETSPDRFALAAVLAQPWCDVVLSGAATVAHLESNLGALDVAPDADALAELLALAEDPEDYWARRSARPWT